MNQQYSFLSFFTFIFKKYFVCATSRYHLRVIVLHAKCTYNGDRDLIPWELSRTFSCNVIRKLQLEFEFSGHFTRHVFYAN